MGDAGTAAGVDGGWYRFGLNAAAAPPGACFKTSPPPARGLRMDVESTHPHTSLRRRSGQAYEGCRPQLPPDLRGLTASSETGSRGGRPAVADSARTHCCRSVSLVSREWLEQRVVEAALPMSLVAPAAMDCHPLGTSDARAAKARVPEPRAVTRRYHPPTREGRAMIRASCPQREWGARGLDSAQV